MSLSIKDIEKVLKDLVAYRENTNKKIVKASKARVVESGRGKNYPGFRPLITYRALAWSSPTVFSIIVFRKNQVVKKEIKLVPSRPDEPPFRFDLLEYEPESFPNIPSLDFADVRALINIYLKLQRSGVIASNKAQIRSVLTPSEYSIINHLNDKHIDYYFERIRDSKKILDFLRKPDNHFLDENSWQALISNVLDDLLTIDRGVIYKIRDERGNLIGLTPLDGTTIKPVVSEDDGSIEYYVQEVDGELTNAFIDKKDIVIFRQNQSPDVYLYGYSIAPLEVLYSVVLTDIFIDKGNLDYYKKGGSVPEGIIAVEPPNVKEDDPYPQLSREQLEGIQRQLQALLLGDYTQIPIVSGGKFTWIDFKGKRRDMQYKELADYVARKICAVYQVSPQDVGILEGVNRATAEVMASLTKAKGLEPLLSTISRGFDSVIREFRKEGDLKLWFDDEDLEKERERWSITQGQLSTGVLTINEVRMQKGLPPVPWGDTPFMGLRNWEPPQNNNQTQQGPSQGVNIMDLLAKQKSIVEAINPLVYDNSYLQDEKEKEAIFKSLGIEIKEKEDRKLQDEIRLDDFTKDLIEKEILDTSVMCDSGELYFVVLYPSARRNQILAWLSMLGDFESTPSIYSDTGKVIVSLKTFKKFEVPENLMTRIDLILSKNKFDYITVYTDPKLYMDEIESNLEGLETCLESQKLNYVEKHTLEKILENNKISHLALKLEIETFDDVLEKLLQQKKIKAKEIFRKDMKKEYKMKLFDLLLEDKELDLALTKNIQYASLLLLMLLGKDDFEGGPEENVRYGNLISQKLDLKDLVPLTRFVSSLNDSPEYIFRDFVVSFSEKDYFDPERFLRYWLFRKYEYEEIDDELFGPVLLKLFNGISVFEILRNADNLIPSEKSVLVKYVKGDIIDEIEEYRAKSIVLNYE